MPVIGSIRRNPEKPTFDLSDYDWLVQQWLADRARHVSEETARGYAQKIKYFGQWWQMEGPKCSWLISEEHFEDFEAWLRLTYRTWRGDKLAFNTRHDAIRRLREMLKWAYDHDITSVNLSKWVRSAEGSRPVRHAATLEQLRLLLAAAKKTNWPERSLAILALLLGAGLRRRESVVSDEMDEKLLAGLLIENIIFYSDSSGVLTVVGKRTKANPSGQRQVAFDAHAGRCLALYLDNLGATSGPLLRNARFKDRALGHKGVYYVVKEVIALAGLGDVIDACHQLRRNYSHYWLKAEDGPADADFLRRNLGHKKYSQTSDYTMLDASDIVPHARSPFSLLRTNDDVGSA